MKKRRMLAILVPAVVVGGLGIAGITNALAATTGTVVSSANGKCLDVTDGSTANGTLPQMWTCSPGPNQSWTYGDDHSLKGLGKCLDVADGATTDGAAVHLWDCYSGLTSQQWTYTAAHDLVNVKAGKCLDIKDNNQADGARLQLWTCTGSNNQKWTVNGGSTTPTTPPSTVPPNPTNPDLGPNVSVFDPSMSAATIQSRLTQVFNQQVSNQFGTQRYAMLFKPGSYNVDANVGFFTQVAGLGLTPDQVTINGHVHAEADWWPDGSQNATQNFWRSAEGLSVSPADGLDRWAVSQAAPYRRMHVRGSLALSDGGWSSGGFLADSKVDGQIQSGTQQQWLTRNSQMGSWTGSNWNQVFVGAQAAPATSFPSPPYTTVGQTPEIAEKPYLYVDSAGAYQVFVPAVRSDSTGTSWASGTPAGTSLPISTFAVVKPGDTAATINAALAAGKNLLVTPATYHLDAPLKVTRANTVVLGLGLATFVPDNGVTAITVADVDGVRVAGLLLDAGTTNSPVLMEVGPTGAAADHSANPTVLSDVFFRIGGSIAGKATVSLRINSDDVIGDHAWIWRADHGNGGTVGWTVNTAQNGLIVNGDDVTFYGLFVEHFQQYQTIWNGENGRTYFYQNEMPYDPPSQAAYMNGSTQGWAAYKVADSVTKHQAYGLGSYAYFNVNPAVVNAHAFEVPAKPGVTFTDMVTVSLGGTGTISHVINSKGAAVNSGHQVEYLVSGP
ncbi:RICIN domain-containing protein [Actinoplanes sp. N902-109]|uniref:RICIN domain-containing protein n=1 Tax=Actinoplanes sp. (strain N902-109) TaxID=649831 RepID=UPI00032958F8|nr:RICIN domain-containing protein [Actinoplanes sp. N902-109]AGL17783.1 secreted protein [Actinoplanes sp. N902-109]